MSPNTRSSFCDSDSRQSSIEGISFNSAPTLSRGFERFCRRERARGCRDALHLAEQLRDPGAGFREPFAQRVPRGIKIIRQRERPFERAAAHFVKRAGRNPFDGIEHAGAGQRIMLGIAGIVRIAGLVQRSLDEEIAGFVARCRAADRVGAFDHQHLAAGARQDRAGGQASEAGADHHYVIARHGINPEARFLA